MNIFIVGFPLKIGLGFIMLATTLPLVVGLLTRLFAGFELEFGLQFSLGWEALTFQANGAAAVVFGPDPGLVLRLNVSVSADIAVFEINAAGTLEINTTNTERLGVAANSFLLDLHGDVAILKVLKFNAGFKVQVLNGGWRFDFNASLDFFGLVTLDGYGFLDSDGNFDFDLPRLQ